jgi:hypothetical protein
VQIFCAVRPLDFLPEFQYLHISAIGPHGEENSMEIMEYCPRCRILVRAVVTETHERRTCPNGVSRDVLVRSLHCAACRCFLRSEDVPLPKVEAQAPNE